MAMAMARQTAPTAETKCATFLESFCSKRTLCPDLRGSLRSSMGLVLKRMAAAASLIPRLAAPTSGSQIWRLEHAWFSVLAAVIRGFRLKAPPRKGDPTTSPLSPCHRALLVELLLPLHAVPGKVSYSEPALSLIYHPLVGCLVEFVRHDPAWALPTIMRRVLRTGPMRVRGIVRRRS